MSTRSLSVVLAVALLLTNGCRRHPSKTPPNSALPSDSRASTLLGGERGLDHVGIAVRDLDAATHAYHDLLGFNRPIEGFLPNGIHNVNYYFGDATYLETLVATDGQRPDWLAAFTRGHSGALFAVLSAFSPEDTTTFLAGRGVAVGKPFSGTIRTSNEETMPEEKWKTFFLPKGAISGDPLYFIAYSRGPRDDYLQKLGDPRTRRLIHHKNTALGLSSVWIAVDDLPGATRSYEKLGLTKGATFVDSQLDATGQRFTAGLGEIWLLAARGDASPIASFLRERGGAGIIGLTLTAGSVRVAADVISANIGESLSPYAGVLGMSVRVPERITLGVVLEFSEPSGASGATVR